MRAYNFPSSEMLKRRLPRILQLAIFLLSRSAMTIKPPSLGTTLIRPEVTALIIEAATLKQVVADMRAQMTLATNEARLALAWQGTHCVTRAAG